MAFLTSLKQAFGFGADNDTEAPGIDASVTPRAMRINSAQTKAEKQPDKAQHTSNSPDNNDPEVMPTMIFNKVVEVFNQALPQFIRDSVNPEAQKQLLFDALDSSLKDYIRQLDDQARRRTRSSWDRDRQKLEGEIQTLRAQTKESREKAESAKQQQLSAERQRRTQTERVHDLEQMVAALEAEKEQFELENKSLLNKLRVSSLGADTDAPNQAELIEQLQSQLQQLQVKADMADKMVSDLTAQATEANSRATELQQQLDDTNAKLTEAQAQLEEANKANAEATRQFEAANTLLIEAQEAAKDYEEQLADAHKQLENAQPDEDMLAVQQQIEQIEQVIDANNKRIRQLTDENNDLKQSLQESEHTIESLRATIEDNVRTHAQAEAELRHEIDALREMPPVAIPAQPAQKPKPLEPKQKRMRRADHAVNAIDESLDNTDWLVAADDSPTPVASEPPADFGYIPPAHKQQPDNDSQLSLW